MRHRRPAERWNPKHTMGSTGLRIRRIFLFISFPFFCAKAWVRPVRFGCLICVPHSRGGANRTSGRSRNIRGENPWAFPPKNETVYGKSALKLERKTGIQIILSLWLLGKTLQKGGGGMPRKYFWKHILPLCTARESGFPASQMSDGESEKERKDLGKFVFFPLFSNPDGSLGFSSWLNTRYQIRDWDGEKRKLRKTTSHSFPPFRKKKGGKGIRPIIDFPFFGEMEKLGKSVGIGHQLSLPGSKTRI